MRNILECSPEQLGSSSKIFVNGNWVGVIDTPIELVNLLKLYRRNGIIPVYTSFSFNYQKLIVLFFLGTWLGSLSHHLADWFCAFKNLKQSRS